ncbi:N-acetylglucosaminyl-diphospho-decaprenol L-rhamnosyltransferase [Tsuneonella dongtanensis]|uniref:N-acetylglucosaminyl-diphospho-decaprenol L-rhamnosyltransferase n=1 Tax=Tsuneonella dongtanensis TaxID=692370 RepID=A0A1B2ABA2_9SPHN|nr:glycosyltransferase family 2 protein [Tsuneonella dongtanensis]ANY19426.1 N-acetylglucosaminyl-diphospho-decaprenol L-rhamnosyltransferase [Tsuneonella dongtanensis]
MNEESRAAGPEVTVVIVSYNTRDLTLRAIETLLAHAGDVRIEVIVWDNASSDGSAEAIKARFPNVELMESHENLGFASANNRAAQRARSPYLLLLNPDTETHPGAVEAAWRFAQANPSAGIVGGRTLFADGSLNPASCFSTITPWSLFCSAIGLSRLFPGSPVFNPEGLGGWKRDRERRVDVISGCFMLVRTEDWRRLGGFDESFFMYGEDHDLCLRAAALGFSPMITPRAEIVHLVGAASPRRVDKLKQLHRARATIVRRHWPSGRKWLGIALMRLWVATRLAGSVVLAPFGRGQIATWREMWKTREEWLKGY